MFKIVEVFARSGSADKCPRGRRVSVLRVTTFYAASAAATAAYYTRYLAEAPGEVPGVWTGDQAAGLGLSGDVSGGAGVAVGP